MKRSLQAGRIYQSAYCESFERFPGFLEPQALTSQNLRHSNLGKPVARHRPQRAAVGHGRFRGFIYPRPKLGQRLLESALRGVRNAKMPQVTDASRLSGKLNTFSPSRIHRCTTAAQPLAGAVACACPRKEYLQLAGSGRPHFIRQFDRGTHASDLRQDLVHLRGTTYTKSLVVHSWYIDLQNENWSLVDLHFRCSALNEPGATAICILLSVVGACRKLWASRPCQGNLPAAETRQNIHEVRPMFFPCSAFAVSPYHKRSGLHKMVEERLQAVLTFLRSLERAV